MAEPLLLIVIFHVDLLLDHSFVSKSNITRSSSMSLSLLLFLHSTCQMSGVISPLKEKNWRRLIIHLNSNWIELKGYWRNVNMRSMRQPMWEPSKSFSIFLFDRCRRNGFSIWKLIYEKVEFSTAFKSFSNNNCYWTYCALTFVKCRSKMERWIHQFADLITIFRSKVMPWLPNAISTFLAIVNDMQHRHVATILVGWKTTTAAAAAEPVNKNDWEIFSWNEVRASASGRARKRTHTWTRNTQIRRHRRQQKQRRRLCIYF